MKMSRSWIVLYERACSVGALKPKLMQVLHAHVGKCQRHRKPHATAVPLNLANVVETEAEPVLYSSGEPLLVRDFGFEVLGLRTRPFLELAHTVRIPPELRYQSTDQVA